MDVYTDIEKVLTDVIIISRKIIFIPAQRKNHLKRWFSL